MTNRSPQNAGSGRFFYSFVRDLRPMAPRYTLMNASDIIRDGLGVELIDENQRTVAEVFRRDSDQTAIVSTFNNDIPLDALEQLLSYARCYLDPFENGKPLDAASNFGLLEQKEK